MIRARKASGLPVDGRHRWGKQIRSLQAMAADHDQELASHSTQLAEYNQRLTALES